MAELPKDTCACEAHILNTKEVHYGCKKWIKPQGFSEVSVLGAGRREDKPCGPLHRLDARTKLNFVPYGRFSSILMRASLPKFASNSRVKGTVEENQAVVQGSVASFGTYTGQSDKEQTVNLHIEGSTFPNWDGQDQKRLMTVKGDELKVTNPAASIGGTNYAIYKRASRQRAYRGGEYVLPDPFGMFGHTFGQDDVKTQRRCTMRVNLVNINRNQ